MMRFKAKRQTVTAVDHPALEAQIEFCREFDAPLVEAMLDPAHAVRGAIVLSLVAYALGVTREQLAQRMDRVALALRATDLLDEEAD